MSTPAAPAIVSESRPPFSVSSSGPPSRASLPSPPLSESRAVRAGEIVARAAQAVVAARRPRASRRRCLRPGRPHPRRRSCRPCRRRRRVASAPSPPASESSPGPPRAESSPCAPVEPVGRRRHRRRPASESSPRAAVHCVRALAAVDRLRAVPLPPERRPAEPPTRTSTSGRALSPSPCAPSSAVPSSVAVTESGEVHVGEGVAARAAAQVVGAVGLRGLGGADLVVDARSSTRASPGPPLRTSSPGAAVHRVVALLAAHPLLGGAAALVDDDAQDVVAVASRELVVARAAVEDVRARTRVERVRAGAAHQRVVAGAAR